MADLHIHKLDETTRGIACQDHMFEPERVQAATHYVTMDPHGGMAAIGSLEECKQQCEDFGGTYAVIEEEEQDAERFDGLS